MRTTLTTLALLLMATAAWCNSPPPSEVRMDKRVVLEFPDDAVKWSLSTNYGDSTRTITLGPDKTFTIPAPRGIITSPPHKHTARLYATDRNGEKRVSEPIDIHWETVAVLDLRGEREVRYRVELTPGEVKLHKIDERVHFSANKLIVIGALLTAVALFMGWAGRRVFKAITRTTPPPGR